ncbi:putative transmembrane protein [Rhodomicrobium vannielii ATCC 17100]|jgi:hypothetical protein|uniref:Putative transmembrane protein n=1 Tax=Rhodomicrobium vannielii (strain ATCC 17100 / DSM 162 / LMG 4299 / NCIMB 10020 / ATH 3.1.1) TaxID=648757 RepID=E3HZY7_RHOVT|nr:hypothetical protein [Rhodomicrobium vannielii]ADP69938.1 putative transmembrane protein [Rhodomicrobium vannielii ATCC 17100]
MKPLIAAACLCLSAAAFNPVPAASIPLQSAPAPTASQPLLKVGCSYYYYVECEHSTWRSHHRWGSRAEYPSRWRSHFRWGSYAGDDPWHSRARSHYRPGSYHRYWAPRYDDWE